MKKLFALALAAITFAACSKKENPTPKIESGFTYSQILDSLRITRHVPYENIEYNGARPYSSNTLTFLDSNEVQEIETRGTTLDTFRYRINLTMETQVLQGVIQEGGYAGKVSVVDYVYTEGAAFKAIFAEGNKITFFTYRRNARADTSTFFDFIYPSTSTYGTYSPYFSLRFKRL